MFAGSSDQLKKILDLKNSLEEATKKYMELKHHTVASNSGDSSASDFEEVEEKDGYENTVSEDVLMPGVTTGTVCGIRKFDTKAGNQSGWNIWSEENSEMVVLCFLVSLIEGLLCFIFKNIYFHFNFHKDNTRIKL
jgi:hypothetical protein